MLRWLPVFSFFVLAGCEDAAVKQCEDYVQNKLKAPSTYKRIEASGAGVPYPKPTQYTVTVEYDAANSYGVLIRETQVCVFPFKDGRVDTSDYIDFDARFTDAAKKDADEIERNAAQSVDRIIAARERIAETSGESVEGAEVAQCYGDYCPCDDPADGLDRLNCKRITEGLDPIKTQEEADAINAIRGE